MKFNKDMTIGEVLAKAPERIDILLAAGMHCIGCPASQAETIEEACIEEACMVHGIDTQEVIDELNKEEQEDEEDKVDESTNNK